MSRPRLRRAMRTALLALACVPIASSLASAGVEASASRHSVLWKVSDTDNSVYLLGSFHLLKADDYPLPVEVESAFEDAESVLFEIDPREMIAPESQVAIRKYAGYEDGLSLSGLLPTPTLDKLDALLRPGGGSVQAIDQSEPWMVSMGLVLGMAQVLGFKAELGLDRHLMARAAQAGKPVAGLETVDAQMRALDATPYTEQVQSLQELVDDPGKTALELEQLHADWRAGDVERLDAGMRADMARKTPHTYRVLDVDRNTAWLPKIEARLRDAGPDDSLVVVGTLHLLGHDGLVEKLRARGYRVERVCAGCKR